MSSLLRQRLTLLRLASSVTSKEQLGSFGRTVVAFLRIALVVNLERTVNALCDINMTL